MITTYHVAAKDGVFYGGVAARGVNVGKRLSRFRTTKESEILNGFALQLGIALPSRYPGENLSRFRSPALCRHEKSSRFQFRRPRPVQNILEDGNAFLRI